MRRDVHKKWILKHLYLFFIAFLLISIPVWILVIAPQFKKFSKIFSYQANILSLDNFYDEKMNAFIGDNISKTNFKYELSQRTPALYRIKNFINVRKQSDELIFNTERIYDINPYSWTHIKTTQNNKKVYLFGPHYANKENFYYKHVNYDAPIELKFKTKEKINGLVVYHYEGKFSVDQTKELKKIASPNRGIITLGTLNLWIEPISGWLVKYQDNAVAYYYDLKTRKILYPWNKFSNRYTQSSIEDQIRISRSLKYKFLMIDVGVPIFLLFLAVLILINHNSKSDILFFNFPQKKFLNKIDPYIFVPLIYFILVSTLIAITYFILIDSLGAKKFTIGIAYWSSDPDYKKTIDGFKAALAENQFINPNNISYIEKNAEGKIENQIDNIQSFVNDKVDLIVTQTTNGTLIAKGITTQIPIVFTISSYPVEAGLVHSIQNSQNNLTGARFYILPEDQFIYFEKIYPGIRTLGFVHHRDEPNSIFQFNDFRQTLLIQGINILDIAAIDRKDLLRQLAEKKHEFDALYLACDIFMHGEGGEAAIKYSKEALIPTLSCDSYNVFRGALLGYVGDFYTNGRLAGYQALWILRGARPEWIQIVNIDRGALLINVNTANLLKANLPTDLIKNAAYLIK